MILIPDKEIQNFCHRWKVKELSLFGSALRNPFRRHAILNNREIIWT
jgi:predicted nucleotidyltransferase